MNPFPNVPNRRRFLAAAAAPLAFVGPVSASSALREPDLLIEVARAFGSLVPAWKRAFQELDRSPGDEGASRKFAEIDARHDEAKRELLRRMRADGCSVVLDRAEGVLYLDANPKASHDGADSGTEACAVVVAPLASAVGLG